MRNRGGKKRNQYRISHPSCFMGLSCYTYSIDGKEVERRYRDRSIMVIDFLFDDDIRSLCLYRNGYNYSPDKQFDCVTDVLLAYYDDMIECKEFDVCKDVYDMINIPIDWLFYSVYIFYRYADIITREYFVGDSALSQHSNGNICCPTQDVFFEVSSDLDWFYCNLISIVCYSKKYVRYYKRCSIDLLMDNLVVPIPDNGSDNSKYDNISLLNDIVRDFVSKNRELPLVRSYLSICELFRSIVIDMMDREYVLPHDSNDRCYILPRR